MTNFMIASGLNENLPEQSGVMYIPEHGETRKDRFTIIWENPGGPVYGADYQWGDSDYLTAWGDGGWYSLDEADVPDPFEPGDNKIIAVFWQDR